MTVLVDTAMVDPAERPELWSGAHARIFFPLAIRFAAETPFAGRVLGHDVGPLTVHRISGDASAVRRTPRQVGAFDPERMLVALALRGRCTVEQGDGRVLLEAGDLSSYESSHPFAVRALEPFELLVLGIPRGLLGARRDAICGRTARHVAGTTGIGAIAASFLGHLWAGVDGDEQLGREDLADGALAVVRAMHGGDAVAPAAAVPGAALIPRIKAHIETHLGELGLGPESIANAHHISTRYVHKLFAVEGTSVSEWIRARRLERCRRDLADPALRGQTIAAIAARWGLTNHAHFSRAFRDAYGCSPRELRAGRAPGP